MKWQKALTTIAFCLLANTIAAASSDFNLVNKLSNLPRVYTINAGPTWARPAQLQAFYLDPEDEEAFIPTKVTSLFGNVELFLGLQDKLKADYLGQLGVLLATTGNVKLQGVIWDEAKEEFDNFVYGYLVKHTEFSLQGKLLRNYYFLNALYQPYIAGRVGLGINYAHNYENAPTIEEAIVLPNFTSKSTLAFTYAVNVGIKRQLSNILFAGLGYEFSDWGISRLGRTPYQEYNTGLTLSHTYTNGLLFHLSFVI